MKSHYVFLDTETAGLSMHHPIIQIAAAAVTKDFDELETYEQKIQFNPSAADPKALEINHYTDAAWKDAVPERVAVVSFGAFLDKHKSLELISKRTGRPYVVARVGGHNISSFDIDRLSGLFKRWKAFLPVGYKHALDTLHGAVWYFAKQEKQPADFRLTTLAEHFGIPVEGAHDALVDVRLSVALAKRFLA